MKLVELGRSCGTSSGRVSDLEGTAGLDGTAYEVREGFVCSVWFLW